MIPEGRNNEIPRRLVYPADEAAELLGGITDRKLRLMVENKEIKQVHIGRRVFFTAEELERYVRSLSEADA